MIAIKKALYMTVPLLTAMTSCVQANDDTSSGTFTIGLGGHYTPRYSGSDKQVWQVVPVLQGRSGAFFIDTQKGVGYDLQNASGWYFEHTLGYDLGRADKNASWRAGANNLKGMGDIDASLNTALAVGWQALSWLSVEGKATLPKLAEKVAMSPRNFTRVFTRETGASPARYVAEARLAAARQRLEQTNETLDRIAEQTGFGSSINLRRLFEKQLNLTPGEYRQRFHCRKMA